MLHKILMAGVVMVAAVAILTSAADAHGMKEYSRTGAWTSFAGINTGGDPQCVTLNWGPLGNSAAAVQLKYDSAHPTHLVVHIVKLSWNIPKGMVLRVMLQVDYAPGRVYNAESISKNVIEIILDLNDKDRVTGESAVQLLINLLDSGLTLNITFPDGNERPWQASLNGSSAELRQFSNCIRAAKTVFDKKDTTQPFGN